MALLVACGGDDVAGPATGASAVAATVTVTGWGEGAGLIRGDAGIECWYEGGHLRGSCSASVPSGTTLSFEALPRDTAVNGVAFEGWAGACPPSNATSCTMTVGQAAPAVSAGFGGVTTLRGRVYHPREGSLAGLGVSLAADGEARGTIPIAGDGSFDGTLLGTIHDAALVQVVVDALDPGARRLYPAFLQLRPWELADPLRLVLVPLTWEVRAGRHRGATSLVELDEALGAEPAFYTTTGQVLVGRIWQFQVQTVTRDRLPLSLVVDRVRSGGRVADVDVDRYWRRIDDLEADVGIDLYRRSDDPASADVVAAVLPGACGRATACASVASGTPFLDGPAEVFHQSVEQFRDGRAIVQHELTHVLGLGHTCRWRSLMSPGVEQCGGLDTGSAGGTATDVALVQLAIDVNTLQRELDVPPFGGGLMAAWNGLRVVLRGLEPWFPPGCAQCAPSARDGR